MTLPSELKSVRVFSRAPQLDVRQTIACVADRQLFAGLMAGGASHVPPPVVDEGLIQRLSDQLLARLGSGDHRPVQFVIDLARRGRVHVSARYERRVWTVSLGAEQAATSQWLAGQQQNCQLRLAHTLGQPVRVQLMQGLQA